MKPGKKKVMVQLWGAIYKAINRDFRALHIKRDAYLNDLLSREIEDLEKEVTFRNSSEVFSRLTARPLPDRAKLTIELDETLIHRINSVLKDKNIPRDSFINRVLFFLLARDSHLSALGIDYERKTRIEGKPLDDARNFLHDPFYPIRVENSDKFYTIPCFQDGPFGRNGPNLFALNTAISDEDWALMNITLEDLGESLGIGSIVGGGNVGH